MMDVIYKDFLVNYFLIKKACIPQRTPLKNRSGIRLYNIKESKNRLNGERNADMSIQLEVEASRWQI